MIFKYRNKDKLRNSKDNFKRNIVNRSTRPTCKKASESQKKKKETWSKLNWDMIMRKNSYRNKRSRQRFLISSNFIFNKRIFNNISNWTMIMISTQNKQEFKLNKIVYLKNKCFKIKSSNSRDIEIC